MISKSKLYSAPAETPITVTEAKLYLKIDTTADDDLVESLIKSATQKLENYTDRKFVTQTWDVAFDGFPYSKNDQWWDGERDGAISELNSPCPFLDMPFGPMASVTSFTVYGVDDTAEVISSSVYQVDTFSPFGRIALRSGQVWPATTLRLANGIIIRGVFGFGAANAVPQAIKDAVKLMVGQMYEHRGDEDPGIPKHVSMLLDPYRRLKV